MAIMCLKEHVIINGLRHHHSMSMSKRGYDYPLHHLWMMSLTKEQRDDVLTFLKANAVPARDVVSFTVYPAAYDNGINTIVYRYYYRDAEGNIHVNQDEDGDWVPQLSTDSADVKTDIPSVIIDALWTHK